MLGKTSLIIVILCVSTALAAQDTLPNFSVESLGNNKTRIGWVNPFGNDLIQLNVQRSFDSTKGFRTIFSTPSPELPMNGFVDTKGNGTKYYYRIFYMFSGNAYFFSKVRSTASGFVAGSILDESKTITVKVRDTIYAVLSFDQFKGLRDSILNNTKDSLFTISDDAVVIKPYIPSSSWIASSYVYTDRTGNVIIKLPQATNRKYSLIIYDADNSTPLYRIKQVTDNELILDKANFVHAGWFVFELFEEDKLKERNKFYLQKEF